MHMIYIYSGISTRVYIVMPEKSASPGISAMKQNIYMLAANQME